MPPPRRQYQPGAPPERRQQSPNPHSHHPAASPPISAVPAARVTGPGSSHVASRTRRPRNRAPPEPRGKGHRCVRRHPRGLAFRREHRSTRRSDDDRAPDRRDDRRPARPPLAQLGPHRVGEPGADHVPRRHHRRGARGARGPRARRPGQDGRQRAQLHRHRGRREATAAPGRAHRHHRRRPRRDDGDRAAGTPLHELNAELEPASGCRCTTWATSTSRPSPGPPRPAPTAPAACRRRCPRRWPGSRWSPARARCCAPTPDENPDVFDRRAGRGSAPSASSPRSPSASSRCSSLEAHERPMALGRGPGVVRRDGRRPPPRRHVLVPPHRPDAWSRPTTGSTDLARPSRSPAGGAWLDDELPVQHRLRRPDRRPANRAPAADPAAQPARRAGRSSERRYSDVAAPRLHHAARVRFREMEYAVPREAGLDALREVRRGDRRARLAGQLPRRDPHRPGRRHHAVHRLGPGLALPRLPRATPATDHTAYFAGVEDVLRGRDGRPHWGKLHTRTAADLAPAYPRCGEFAGAARPARPGPGLRQRPPAAACWATDPDPLRRWRGRAAAGHASRARSRAGASTRQTPAAGERRPAGAASPVRCEHRRRPRPRPAPGWRRGRR